jgi:hypothetical protein
VAAVGAIVTELVYFAVSVALVVAVGQALSRSGRAFLDEAYGAEHDGAAQAVSRLLVVAFYLLSMGFVVLTAPSWTRVTGPGQAAGLLTGKIGVLLLVLGFLHVTSTVIVARLRRGRSWAVPGSTDDMRGGDHALDADGDGAFGPGPGDRGTVQDTLAPAAMGGRRDAAAAPGLWRPGRVVH